MSKSQTLAIQLKKDVVNMLNRAQASHTGGCLSCLDIVSVLYQEILNIK
ncbi:MAG TPA: transketolase, partial [Candidatus Dadabacteria bacterium]|nr:transketolase [Candidatus Dadabacteria bacterium]